MKQIEAIITGYTDKEVPVQYKTVIPKGTQSLAYQLSQSNAKYIIRYVFDLQGQTVHIPPNCILAIDGGQIINGTLVGDNTLLLNVNSVESILENVTQKGTWTQALYEGKDITIDMQSVDTEGKAIVPSYKRIVIRSGEETIADYITQVVELVDIVYPKVWFIPSDTPLTLGQIETYIDSNNPQESAKAYTKTLTTTDYYLILEKPHYLVRVLNPSGFDYTSSFNNTELTSSNYNIYHYNRTIAPTINLTFTLN